MLDSSKLKEFADDNFKFDENGRKFSKRVENTGKRKNCSISPFPRMFLTDMYSRQVKTCVTDHRDMTLAVKVALTHYHTVPHFDALKDTQLWKTL